MLNLIHPLSGPLIARVTLLLFELNIVDSATYLVDLGADARRLLHSFNDFHALEEDLEALLEACDLLCDLSLSLRRISQLGFKLVESCSDTLVHGLTRFQELSLLAVGLQLALYLPPSDVFLPGSAFLSSEHLHSEGI